MTTTFDITPEMATVTDGAGGTTVTFDVTRSGDTPAATYSWNVVGGPDAVVFAPNGGANAYGNSVIATNKAYFAGSDGNLPDGTISFSSGQTEQQVTVNLNGNIDNLPNNLDSGGFQFGVQVDATNQSTSQINDTESGGFGITESDYTITQGGGTLELDYNMYTIPDRADIYVDGKLAATTGGPVSHTGKLTYPGGSMLALNTGDQIRVILTGNIQGTLWTYNLDYAPGLSKNVDSFVQLDTGPPGLAELARLSKDIYATSLSASNGYEPIGAPFTDESFQAGAYTNEDSSQIVVAFRGTDLSDGFEVGVKNLLADSSFGTGVPTANFIQYIKDAVSYVVNVHAEFPDANITLTGHSLGGGIAQIIGKATGLATRTFDAPAAGLVYPALQALGLFDNGSGLGSSTTNSNYRLYGDQVSLTGYPLSGVSTYTVANTTGSDNLLDFLDNHSIGSLISQLANPQVTPTAGAPDSTAGYVPLIQGALVPIVYLTAQGRTVLGVVLTADALTKVLLDPAAGTTFTFTEQSGSPFINSILLPNIPGVASYHVENETGGVWSASQIIAPEQTVGFGAGVEGIRFEAFDGSGNAVQLPSSFLYEQSFDTSGPVKGTLVVSNGGGASNQNDLNGDGDADILLNDANSALYFWQMNGVQIDGGGGISALGGGWSYAGAGDFNGDTMTDVVLKNTNGGLALWEMDDSKVIGGGVFGSLSTGWSLAGTGDFNGDGASDLLLHNTNGGLAIWEMNGAQIIGGGVIGALGSGWSVAGTGDFNDDGNSDLLFANTNGALGIWEMNGTQTTGGGVIGQIGTGWSVAGTGDFNADGFTDILLKNTNGALAEWLMNGAQVTGGGVIGQIGTGWSVASIGDFNGDGRSDILLHNTSGATAIWEMNGTKVVGGGAIGTIGAGWSVL